MQFLVDLRPAIPDFVDGPLALPGVATQKFSEDLFHTP
jgi:hypothetical protein